MKRTLAFVSGAALLWASLALIPACSDDGDTAAGSGGSTSVTTTTSSTMVTDCKDVDVNDDAQCNQCVNNNCCDELVDCVDDKQTCPVAQSCINSACDVCFYPICDAEFMGEPIGQYVAKDCAECNGDNCCQELKDCLDDTDCVNCLLANDATACEAGGLDEALDSCEADNCLSECD